MSKLNTRFRTYFTVCREKKAVLFIGDGISKQNHDALLCEILRSESKATVGLTLGALNSSLAAVQGQAMSNFTLKVRSGLLYLQP